MQDANGLPESFNLGLRDVLIELRKHQYPYLPSPPNLKKRASVALIIRINPRYCYWPPETTGIGLSIRTGAQDTRGEIETFFSQDWVMHGTAEVLFIKRANRQGDRWTGHVALPGGGREPSDKDDTAAAVRETLEEVGIDLMEDGVLHVGNLPQRLVTSSWGKVPYADTVLLMVLCPYIFLLTRHDLQPLRLQPSEIGSTHWVSLTSLLSPSGRTFEYQDVSSRLAKQDFGLRRVFYKVLLGHMLFSAVRLVPSESLMSAPPDPAELTVAGASVLSRTVTWLGFSRTRQPAPDLLLWGLTLGVLADFLELLPPHNALQLWTYPTFSMPDVRVLVWALSYGFRKRRYEHIRNNPAIAAGVAEIEVGLDSIPKPCEDAYHRENPPGAGEGGTGVLREHEGQSRRRVRRSSRSSRIGFMLEGYYEIIRRAIALAMIGRGVTVMGTMLWLWHRYRYRSRNV